MANMNAGENGKSTRFRSDNRTSVAGRKGGKASGVARRQSSCLCDAFRAFMTDEDRLLIYEGMLERAKDGDVKAATFLRETMREYIMKY